jgi:hypothetical protein
MRRWICWVVLGAAMLPFATSAFLGTAAGAANAPPTVSGIAPQSGPWTGGTTVTLTGTNLENAYTVMFGDMGAGILSDSDTQITARSPMGSGAVNVSVTTPYGTVDTEEFFYLPPPTPTLSGISPSSGPPAGGTTVTLTGTNLQLTSSVYFGSTSATLRSISDTDVTVTAPPGSGTVEVVTYNPGGESNAVSFTYAEPQHGYWLVGSDGGIFTFGSALFHGSTGNLVLQRPVVGITPTANEDGYWLVASDGGVFAFDAPFVGSIPGLGLHPAGSGLPDSLNAPIVGIVPSVNDQGYYMVASDGGVFAFNSNFAGSCPGIGGCSGAAVAVAPDATGNGYWLVTASGHVYTFGDATYHGAPGPQSSLITAMVRTPDGGGYWILDASGQVFGYGSATNNLGGPTGSVGGLNPATSIFATSDGGGYWVASANGSVFPYGDAPDEGSMAGTHLNGSIIAGSGF